MTDPNIFVTFSVDGADRKLKFREGTNQSEILDSLRNTYNLTGGCLFDGEYIVFDKEDITGKTLIFQEFRRGNIIFNFLPYLLRLIFLSRLMSTSCKLKVNFIFLSRILRYSYVLLSENYSCVGGIFFIVRISTWFFLSSGTTRYLF